MYPLRGKGSQDNVPQTAGQSFISPPYTLVIKQSFQHPQLKSTVSVAVDVRIVPVPFDAGSAETLLARMEATIMVRL
jgi:hypothetical protein